MYFKSQHSLQNQLIIWSMVTIFNIITLDINLLNVFIEFWDLWHHENSVLRSFVWTVFWSGLWIVRSWGYETILGAAVLGTASVVEVWTGSALSNSADWILLVMMSGFVVGSVWNVWCFILVISLSTTSLTSLSTSGLWVVPAIVSADGSSVDLPYPGWMMNGQNKASKAEMMTRRVNRTFILFQFYWCYFLDRYFLTVNVIIYWFYLSFIQHSTEVKPIKSYISVSMGSSKSKFGGEGKVTSHNPPQI